MSEPAHTQMFDLTGRVIAITRPLEQAQRLSAMIHEQGGKTLSFPLLAITPLQDYRVFNARIAEIAAVDWAIFISSNAVEHAMPRLIKQHQEATPPATLKLRYAAIGPVTAQAIKAHGAALGITEVLTPMDRFDSEALLATPEMQAVDGRRILIFRGVGGREVLAETLKKRGALVDFAESYQRVNPQQNCFILEEACAKQACDAIVVTSSEAMRHLIALANGAKWLKSLPICVNHVRIKDEVSHLDLSIAVADAPGDTAMLACINRVLKPHLTPQDAG